jgi:hypothetical protein
VSVALGRHAWNSSEPRTSQRRAKGSLVAGDRARRHCAPELPPKRFSIGSWWGPGMADDRLSVILVYFQ